MRNVVVAASLSALLFACGEAADPLLLDPTEPTSQPDVETDFETDSDQATVDTIEPDASPIADAIVIEQTPQATDLAPVDEVTEHGDSQTRVLSYTVDNDAQARFLQLLNEERATRNLNRLHVFWDLEDDAHLQTERMIDRGDIYHNPDLGSVTRDGIWSRIGENVGRGGSADSLHQAFMNSPGHRDNVLGDYTHVGIGPQRSDSGTLFVTFVFMKATVSGLENTMGPFVDDDGNAHEAAIAKIAAEEITVGCDSTGRRFCPNRSVTRGQMAAFLVRAFDLPNTNNDYFTDDDGTWYESVANRLAASGITAGCSQDGTRYCGSDDVTRGQMAAFLTRALNLPPASGDYFADDAGSFYEDSANRMYESGITRGCGGDSYCGDDPVTRAQMATFLTRGLGL